MSFFDISCPAFDMLLRKMFDVLFLPDIRAGARPCAERSRSSRDAAVVASVHDALCQFNEPS